METFDKLKIYKNVQRDDMTNTNKLYNSVINIPSSLRLNFKTWLHWLWFWEKVSKRLKRKNQLKINGISLVERTIDFACSLKFVDKVILFRW